MTQPRRIIRFWKEFSSWSSPAKTVVCVCFFELLQTLKTSFYFFSMLIPGDRIILDMTQIVFYLSNRVFDILQKINAFTYTLQSTHWVNETYRMIPHILI